MEVVIKCNEGFSTPTKAGTLVLPKGIDFLLKALQMARKKPMSTIKNLPQISYIYIRLYKSRAENSDCSSSWLFQGICRVEHVKETGDGVTEETSLLLHEIGEAKAKAYFRSYSLHYLFLNVLETYQRKSSVSCI